SLVGSYMCIRDRDLPIGGESSIGRGRLQGIHADICHQEKCHQEKKWTIHGKDSLKIIQNGAQESLESYVQKLVNKVE
ncbi:MAG: hypothetical protein ACK556_25610, partial [Pseudanabaena sp.]